MARKWARALLADALTCYGAAVGPAYPAGFDPYDDFSRSCCGNRGFLDSQLNTR